MDLFKPRMTSHTGLSTILGKGMGLPPIALDETDSVSSMKQKMVEEVFTLKVNGELICRKKVKFNKGRQVQTEGPKKRRNFYALQTSMMKERSQKLINMKKSKIIEQSPKEFDDGDSYSDPANQSSCSLTEHHFGSDEFKSKNQKSRGNETSNDEESKAGQVDFVGYKHYLAKNFEKRKLKQTVGGISPTSNQDSLFGREDKGYQSRKSLAMNRSPSLQKYQTLQKSKNKRRGQSKNRGSERGLKLSKYSSMRSSEKSQDIENRDFQIKKGRSSRSRNNPEESSRAKKKSGERKSYKKKKSLLSKASSSNRFLIKGSSASVSSNEDQLNLEIKEQIRINQILEQNNYSYKDGYNKRRGRKSRKNIPVIYNKKNTKKSKSITNESQSGTGAPQSKSKLHCFTKLGKKKSPYTNSGVSLIKKPSKEEYKEDKDTEKKLPEGKKDSNEGKKHSIKRKPGFRQSTPHIGNMELVKGIEESNKKRKPKDKSPTLNIDQTPDKEFEFVSFKNIQKPGMIYKVFARKNTKAPPSRQFVPLGKSILSKSSNSKKSLFNIRKKSVDSKLNEKKENSPLKKKRAGNPKTKKRKQEDNNEDAEADKSTPEFDKITENGSRVNSNGQRIPKSTEHLRDSVFKSFGRCSQLGEDEEEKLSEGGSVVQVGSQKNIKTRSQPHSIFKKPHLFKNSYFLRSSIKRPGSSDRIPKNEEGNTVSLRKSLPFTSFPKTSGEVITPVKVKKRKKGNLMRNHSDFYPSKSKHHSTHQPVHSRQESHPERNQKAIVLRNKNRKSNNDNTKQSGHKRTKSDLIRKPSLTSGAERRRKVAHEIQTKTGVTLANKLGGQNLGRTPEHKERKGPPIMSAVASPSRKNKGKNKLLAFFRKKNNYRKRQLIGGGLSKQSGYPPVVGLSQNRMKRFGSQSFGLFKRFNISSEGEILSKEQQAEALKKKMKGKQKEKK